jgi:hypothetical protein
MRKAQGLSLTTIIIAVIVLVVLIVMIMIFTGQIGRWGGDVTAQREGAQTNSCSDANGELKTSCESTEKAIFTQDALLEGKACCISK